MPNDLNSLNTPDKIADAAGRIYDQLKGDLEKESSLGHFVVIDVVTEEPYVAEFPEDALEKARKAAPYGVFHLIRIGSPGAFKVGYVSHHDSTRHWHWPLRQAR